MSWLVLGLALPVVAAGAWTVWRRPGLAVYAFVVGLALHNAVFLLLWVAGAGGWQLRVAQAWKEILLAAALAAVAWRALRERRLPAARRPLDLAALALAAIAVAYFLVPQEVLAGSADLRARAYGLRDLLVPMAAYVLGRALPVGPTELRRLAGIVLATGAAVAAVGIAESYAVSLEAWRSAGAAGYFTQQLDFPAFHGPAGLPDNFVLNTADGVFRRLVSTFLSPNATAYVLAAALVVAAAVWPRARRRAVVACAVAVMLAAFLLAFSRAAALALVGALVLLALARRRVLPAVTAAVVLGLAAATAAGFTSLAPRTHFFPEDLPYQEARAREAGEPLAPGSPLETTRTLSDPSSEEHLAELERGFRNLARHPEGYGLGNAGPVAERFDAARAAGESLFLSTGIQTGAVGLAALVALAAAVLVELYLLARRAASPELRTAAAILFAVQAAIFAVGVQTEVWNVPWLAYVPWLLTGAVVAAAAPRPAPAPEVTRRGLSGIAWRTSR